MKKHIFSLLGFAFFVGVILAPWAPQVTHAQITTSGCYVCSGTSNANSCTKVGIPDAAGNCAQGNPIFVNASTGQIAPGTGVPNSLSYTPLEPIPGQANKQPNFCELLNILFKVLIYLGGMIAVLFLVLGGIAYMVSEVVDKRTVARERIKSSVIGLIILLSTYLILFTINPNLVNACNVLSGNSGGVVQTQASIEAQNATAVMTANRNTCRAKGGIFEIGGACGSLMPNCVSLNTIGCCQNMAPGQRCYIPGMLTSLF